MVPPSLVRPHVLQELRVKSSEARARQAVETSLILLEGQVGASAKRLDLLLGQMEEVGERSPGLNFVANIASNPLVRQQFFE